jgi:isoamylase
MSMREHTGRTISAGKHYPLGATPRDGGVNFAIHSKHATEVFLLLFEPGAKEPSDVIRLPHRDRHVWHGFVHGVGAGQHYGYKIAGPFDPAHGHRFNPRKLLVDPYAKALSHKPENTNAILLAYDPARGDLSLDERDSTAVAARSIVVDDTAFDWQGVRSPERRLEELVIYEVHVKGFTAHSSSGVRERGTYLGFIEKIPHLTRLGVNAVELLPIHEIYVEDYHRERGLTNYWGYNTLSFFAPESSYGTRRAVGCEVEELKTLVRELHRAGIEVILDVVYNHTAEGNERGPTLSLRGVDNASYYCLTGPAGEPGRYYHNHTGCGNSLDLGSGAAIRLVMDSLRYWAEAFHIDGFRFDLASVLGRENGGFRTSATFFDAVAQDPVLARVKLIAEPWDLGTYEVGNFPIDWSEWNGRFRDTVRKFVKGDEGQVPELAARLTGSADLYGDDGRSAFNSVNFVTCHDGFTLNDLVSYAHKHNDKNLEENRDGCNDNHSWNCGAEGETSDASIVRLRRQLAKNYLACLFLSNGTPMLLGGDEMLRTQGGNNNAYCLDDETSWYDWRLLEKNADMFEFVRRIIALSRRFGVLSRRKFFVGRDHDGNAVADIEWYGRDLARPHWSDPHLRLLCYQLDGAEAPSATGPYRLFFIHNASHEPAHVALPISSGLSWRRAIDTSLEPGMDIAPAGEELRLDPQDHYLASGRSVVLLVGS